MKRFFLFLAAVMLYVAGVAFGKCPSVLTIRHFSKLNAVITVGEHRWVLYSRSLYRHDLTTGTAIKFDPEAESDGSFVSYTSENSSLIDGGIDRVLIDDQDHMIAIGAHGKVAIFDGQKWMLPRTTPHKVTNGVRYEGILDARMINGTAVFADSYGVWMVQRGQDVVANVATFPEPAMNAHITDSDKVVYVSNHHHGIVDINTGRMITHDESNPTHESECELYAMERSFQAALNQNNERVMAIADSVYELRIDRHKPVVYMCGFSRAYYQYNVNDMTTDRHGNVYLALNNGVIVIKATTQANVDEQAVYANIIVHPNPAVDAATMELPFEPEPGLTVSIVDVTGRVVSSMPISERSTTLDVSLLKGAYRVVVEGRRYRTSVPLMVVR